VSSGKATPEQLLAAVKAELVLLRRSLIACRKRALSRDRNFPGGHLCILDIRTYGLRKLSPQKGRSGNRERAGWPRPRGQRRSNCGGRG
jgi:hypothetical protein